MASLRYLVFVFLAVTVMFTGCARKPSKKQQINSLQAQVGVLTDEVARLDQSLQETRASIESEQAHSKELESQLGQSSSRLGHLREEESVIKGIYRTPSGFELPSINIQKALKSAGYYQGTLDGKIGPSTREAVKAFQRDNGLEPDGVVGKKTWNKLKTYLKNIK